MFKFWKKKTTDFTGGDVIAYVFTLYGVVYLSIATGTYLIEHASDVAQIGKEAVGIAKDKISGLIEKEEA